MGVGLRVGELDGADATKIIEVAGNVCVGGSERERIVCDEKVGLGDVGCGYVVAEEVYDGGGLSLGVFAQYSGAEGSEKNLADVMDRRLARRRVRLKRFMEEL